MDLIRNGQAAYHVWASLLGSTAACLMWGMYWSRGLLSDQIVLDAFERLGWIGLVGGSALSLMGMLFGFWMTADDRYCVPPIPPGVMLFIPAMILGMWMLKALWLVL